MPRRTCFGAMPARMLADPTGTASDVLTRLRAFVSPIARTRPSDRRSRERRLRPNLGGDRVRDPWRAQVHRSTYYRWADAVKRSGLEMLRPRERRAPRMPNQIPQMICERILAFSIAHPGFGPDRISSELRFDRWGGICVSANGVRRVLRRHGLNRKHARYALVAGYAAPYEPPREQPAQAHIDVQRPGELSVSTASMYVSYGGLKRDLDAYIDRYTTTAPTTAESPRDASQLTSSTQPER